MHRLITVLIVVSALFISRNIWAFFAVAGNDGIFSSVVVIECIVAPFAHRTSIASSGIFLPSHPIGRKWPVAAVSGYASIGCASDSRIFVCSGNVLLLVIANRRHIPPCTVISYKIS